MNNKQKKYWKALPLKMKIIVICLAIIIFPSWLMMIALNPNTKRLKINRQKANLYLKTRKSV
ncbi:MAG: hypothetical protein QXL94_07025 [Candidatus Parvarchaeum sp.]